jgi:hypothetical protein
MAIDSLDFVFVPALGARQCDGSGRSHSFFSGLGAAGLVSDFVSVFGLSVEDDGDSFFAASL